MKGFLHYLLLFVLFFCSCKNDEAESEKSENDVDAARNFIRAALDGDYERARNYMLNDSLNTQLLNTFQDNYRTHMNREDKAGYRESSIRMPEIRRVNDSASVVVYSNSYKNKSDTLKVVREKGQWLVDFKYSFPVKDSFR
jgi:hypothetical protein